MSERHCGALTWSLHSSHMVLTAQGSSQAAQSLSQVLLLSLAPSGFRFWRYLSALQYSVMRYLALSSGYLALSRDSYHIRRGRIA